MADAAVLGSDDKVTLDDAVFGAPFNGPLVHEAVVAELAARRRGTHATLHAREGPRRRRQALAPEGHRPRARRHVALAAVDRRRHRVRPEPPPLHRQGQPQGAPRRAARRALGARRARLAVRARRRRLRRAVDQAGARPRLRAPRRLGARGARRRGPGRGGQVVPQPRRRQRAAGRRGRRGRHRRRRDAGRLARRRWTCIAPHRAARAKCAGEERRRPPDGRQPGDHPPGRLREVLRPGDGRQVHVPRPQGREQDADPQAIEQLFDVGVLEVRTSKVPLQAQAPRLHRPGARASGRRPSCRCARATRSRSSRAWRPICNADPQAQAHVAGPALRHLSRTSRRSRRPSPRRASSRA